MVLPHHFYSDEQMEQVIKLVIVRIPVHKVIQVEESLSSLVVLVLVLLYIGHEILMNLADLLELIEE